MVGIVIKLTSNFAEVYLFMSFFKNYITVIEKNVLDEGHSSWAATSILEMKVASTGDFYSCAWDWPSESFTFVGAAPRSTRRKGRIVSRALISNSTDLDACCADPGSLGKISSCFRRRKLCILHVHCDEWDLMCTSRLPGYSLEQHLLRCLWALIVVQFVLFYTGILSFFFWISTHLCMSENNYIFICCVCLLRCCRRLRHLDLLPASHLKVTQLLC